MSDTGLVRVVLFVSMVLLVAACYGPSINPCNVTCSSSTECPSGSTCSADNRCQPTSGPACGSDGDGGIDGPDDGDGSIDAPPNTGTWKALAVGRHVGCAIGLDDSQVYCWGNNAAGQLGEGSTSNRPDARPIDEPGPWRVVAAGSRHACAIKESGELFCWGDAAYGQVTGSNANQIEADPKRLVHPMGKAWTAVDGGARHTCAIDVDEDLWCWGSNDAGQLGTGGAPGVQTPVKVLPTGMTDGMWKSVSADEVRTCAIWGSGVAYCWGVGALGLTGMATLPHEQASATPAAVAGGSSWRSLSVAQDHTCGVTTGNALLCWGNEQLGELGTGSTSAEPVAAQSGSDFGIVFAGPLMTCATRTNPDTLLCFGDNREGQLGNGARGFQTPTMPAITGKVIAGGAGENFTCALTEDGALSCWGRDDDGRCGDGRPDDQFISAPVTGVTGPLAVLATTVNHTCAVTSAAHPTAPGRLYCWGVNSDGQLGVGDEIDRAVPVEVPRPSGMSWTDVATGMAHTCGLAGGKLYCWGSDDNLQLGNGNAGAADTPQAIVPAMSWQSVGVGTAYSCALDTNSARWCWGSNLRDALGGGASVGTDLNVPTLMSPGMGPTAWLSVVGGDLYGCGIGAGANAREVWCWGDNDEGQLGAGPTPATSNVPRHATVTAPDQFRELATDSLWGAVCGIRAPDASGGELWCWGFNETYQLGTGDMMAHDTPIRIGTDTWLRVDIGLNFSCGIDATLGLRCWGANTSLQVGDANTGTVTSIPSVRTWPNDVMAIATGWQHACLLAANNQIHCWGDGNVGQLGDGNMAHLTPTPVVRGP